MIADALTAYNYECTCTAHMPKQPSTAAKQLRKRFQPEMTGAELARSLRVTRQAVANWLTGESLPSPRLMARIEDLTGIPMRAWTEFTGTDADEVQEHA